jgi:hypothetical protein
VFFEFSCAWRLKSGAKFNGFFGFWPRLGLGVLLSTLVDFWAVIAHFLGGFL